MSAPLFDVTAGPASPSMDPGFQGIAIRAEAHVVRGVIERRTLHGAYRLTIDDARAIDAVPLQRAVVITITAGLEHWSWNPIGDTLLFEDDEHGRGGIVRGFFNLELPADITLEPGRVCYVVVSMGPVLSNILELGAG